MIRHGVRATDPYTESRTYVRTDGLTNVVVTSRDYMTVSERAREENTDFARCCCTAKRIYCPRNCFLRWF